MFVRATVMIASLVSASALGSPIAKNTVSVKTELSQYERSYRSDKLHSPFNANVLSIESIYGLTDTLSIGAKISGAEQTVYNFYNGEAGSEKVGTKIHAFGLGLNWLAQGKTYKNFTLVRAGIAEGLTEAPNYFSPANTLFEMSVLTRTGLFGAVHGEVGVGAKSGRGKIPAGYDVKAEYSALAGLAYITGTATNGFVLSTYLDGRLVDGKETTEFRAEVEPNSESQHVSLNAGAKVEWRASGNLRAHAGYQKALTEFENVGSFGQEISLGLTYLFKAERKAQPKKTKAKKATKKKAKPEYPEMELNEYRVLTEFSDDDFSQQEKQNTKTKEISVPSLDEEYEALKKQEAAEKAQKAKEEQANKAKIKAERERISAENKKRRAEYKKEFEDEYGNRYDITEEDLNFKGLED